MKYKTIIMEKKDGIAILTLNRPETLNAWNATMAEEVTNALNEINKDKKTRIMIITGAGRGFSSGADLGKESSTSGKSKTSEMLYMRLAQGKPTVVDIGLRLQRLDKPVIGAINGVAVGAGLSIALACDLRIASEKAQFSMIFVKRGLIPDCGGSFFLPKLIGSAKACELIFTGDIIDAGEAERIGLVNKVVPHEELMKTTEELANKLLKRPPISLKYAKRAIYKGLTEVNLASHIDYEISLNRMLHDTEDLKEGVKAFLEKREPLFKGK